MQDLDRRLEERKNWLNGTLEFISSGRVAEFGCGSGVALEYLSRNRSECVFLGVDKSPERLKQASLMSLKNVYLIAADMTGHIFRDNSIGTALFIGSLHEVFSAYGHEGVIRVLALANRALGTGGLSLVQDFLKPSPERVAMVFRNMRTRDLFFKFAREFRPRDVVYETDGDGVVLDIADAVDFISKYRSPTPEIWREEMSETHFFFGEGEYKEAALLAGSTVRNVKRLPESKWGLLKAPEDIECDFECPDQWIQVVLQKK
jgi:SAM-dependent methyltransferase